MADTWMVTGQQERTRLVGVNVVRVMEVGFLTTLGDTGWVDIPLTEYVPDHVALTIHALATGFDEVHHMEGVMVTSVHMRNDWPSGTETPMVVIAFTASSGATATIELPADTFDPQTAEGVITARAHALDTVAGL